jgi:NAD(P)-dependent dehydrogenase (short-subunit alcohol dehydrogenase family)
MEAVHPPARQRDPGHAARQGRAEMGGEHDHADSWRTGCPAGRYVPLIQKALPLLNDGGSIVLTGSVGSAKGTPGFAVYSATKAAIRNFVRAWTVELKDRRIRPNILSPGPTETTLQGSLPSETIARLASAIPMGRMGSPEEIAKAALFLASDDSSFVTGIELFVDGGGGQI